MNIRNVYFFQRKLEWKPGMRSVPLISVLRKLSTVRTVNSRLARLHNKILSQKKKLFLQSRGENIQHAVVEYFFTMCEDVSL